MRGKEGSLKAYKDGGCGNLKDCPFVSSAPRRRLKAGLIACSRYPAVGPQDSLCREAKRNCSSQFLGFPRFRLFFQGRLTMAPWDDRFQVKRRVRSPTEGNRTGSTYWVPVSLKQRTESNGLKFRPGIWATADGSSIVRKAALTGSKVLYLGLQLSLPTFCPCHPH